HYYLAGHLRVYRAEVSVRSWLGERVRKLLVRIQHLGLEHFVVADHGMRDIVAIGPSHRGSRRNGDRRGAKAEIVDLYFSACRLGLLRACRKTSWTAYQKHRRHKHWRRQ